MGFSTISDYQTKAVTNGQGDSVVWQKTLGAVGAFTAGRWYNMCYFAGTPMLSRPGERLANGQLWQQSAGALANWTGIGSGWTYTSTTNPPTVAHTAGTTALVATGTQNIQIGSVYAVEFYCSAYATATYAVTMGGSAASATISATGQYHYTYLAASNTDLTITPTNTDTCTISNFSVVLINAGIPLFGTDMGAIYLNPVSPATRSLQFVNVMSSAANFVPGTWKLVDMLMAYPVNMNVTNATTLPSVASATTIGGTTNYLVQVGGNHSVPFQNGAGAWTYGSGWAYASPQTVTATTPSGTLSLPVANFSTFSGAAAANAPIAGYVYNVMFTISGLSGNGTMTAGIGGGTSAALTLANGTYTLPVTAVNASGALTFTIASGSPSFTMALMPAWITPAFSGSWTYGTGWAQTSSTVATATSASGTLSLPVANMTAGNVPVVGYVYNITYMANVTAWTSLTLSVGIGGATSQVLTFSSTGIYQISQSVTAVNTTGALIFTITGTNTTAISGISIRVQPSSTVGSGVEVGLPRYTSGTGVKACLCWHSGAWQAAGTGVVSATAHNVTLGYTNDSGVMGQFTPVPVTGFSGAIPTMGHLDNSGAGGAVQNNTAPFFPLDPGDGGIRSVQSVILSAYAGANNYATLILCKELLTICNATASVATERDYINQARSMPQIQDGANLQWLFFPGAATAVSTSAVGQLDFVWG